MLRQLTTKMMLSKKEIEKLNKKRITLDPDNESKEYTTEL